MIRCKCMVVSIHKNPPSQYYRAKLSCRVKCFVEVWRFLPSQETFASSFSKSLLQALMSWFSMYPLVRIARQPTGGTGLAPWRKILMLRYILQYIKCPVFQITKISRNWQYHLRFQTYCRWEILMIILLDPTCWSRWTSTENNTWTSTQGDPRLAFLVLSVTGHSNTRTQCGGSQLCPILVSRWGRVTEGGTHYWCGVMTMYPGKQPIGGLTMKKISTFFLLHDFCKIFSISSTAITHFIHQKISWRHCFAALQAKHPDSLKMCIVRDNHCADLVLDWWVRGLERASCVPHKTFLYVIVIANTSQLSIQRRFEQHTLIS